MAKRYETNRKIKVPVFHKNAGFVTNESRSSLMSRITGKGTSPELLLRKALWELGVRYRVNVRSLPGSPDIVIRKSSLVIFVDGEFWHGYNWEAKRKKIKSNRKYWIAKIERNMQRDKQNALRLKTKGFKVMRFWQHEVKKDLMRCIKEIMQHLER